MNNTAEHFNCRTCNLIFRHLYDDVWGVLTKPRRRWEKPGIIMPSGFQPETGKSYECILTQTMTGSFVYKSIKHDLWIAELTNEADIFDQADYMVEQEIRKIKNNPLAEKLANLKDRFPERHEIVKLEVVPDMKQGGRMFAPQYLDEDPRVDGKPSMRFYVHPKVDKLKLGETVRARVKRSHDTGKVNRKGVCILQVHVEII